MVKHGQSAYNLQNRFTGEIDVLLTDYGVEEALMAGQKIRQSGDIAFTSSLKHVYHKLEIILESLGLKGKVPIVFDRALNERHYGKLQGLNKAETAAKYSAEKVHEWRRSFRSRPPGGESLSDIYERVISFYETHILELRLSKNVVVVANGNSLRALMMHLESIDERSISNIEIPTGLPRLYTFQDNMELQSVGYL